MIKRLLAVALLSALAPLARAGDPGGNPAYPPIPPAPGPWGPGVSVDSLLGQGDRGTVMPPPDLPPPTIRLAPLPPGGPAGQGRLYTVVQGDTLWGIAARFCGSGFKWKEIYYANRDKIRNPHWIYPGQQFRVSCSGGAAPVYPDPKGGKPGSGYPPTSPPPTGGSIGAGAQPLSPEFAWIKQNPLPPGSWTISSPFGESRPGHVHSGVDLATRPGARPQIGAVAAGRVVAAGWIDGYGYCVYVDHGNGYTTRYGHMAPPGPAVQQGQMVGPGTVLGRVNSTGNSTGDHLHFEIRRGGTALNPCSCMKL